MQRGYIVMIIGIVIEIINYVIGSAQMAKGTSAYLVPIGWVIFFAGFGIRQLDKRKTQVNQSRKK